MKVQKYLQLFVSLGVCAFAAASANAAPCDATTHRQLDFWVGDWKITGADGKQVGTNRIERQYEGCVIHEHYVSDRGYKGESLNVYDPARKVWHQTWVDNAGSLLTLEGGLNGSSMVMKGQTPGPNGGTIEQRVTLTPNADGTVRQHWESTDANGKWNTVFDGVYSKK